MPAEIDFAHVALYLSTLWGRAKSPAFGRYVLDACGVEVNDRPQFRRLYIGLTVEGDPDKGPTPGLIEQWWEVDDSGFRETVRAKLGPDTDADFFATPVVLFHLTQDRVVILERLGPRLAAWKAGRVERTDDGVRIVDVRLIPRL